MNWIKQILMRPIRPSFLLLLMAALVLLASGPTFGQSSVTGGKLSGSVADGHGAAIAGAHVEILNSGTGGTRAFNTDAAGRFETLLPSGDYAINITSPGFAAYHMDHVSIAVGSGDTLSIVLRPATLAQNVTVTADSSGMDTTTTDVASTIDKERIEELPVLSRNALDFALLTPGLIPSSQPASGGALENSGFVFAGQRPRSNVLLVDGIGNNDAYSGSGRTELSPETVREFQVVNSGISAETGGGGSSLNVVTRSGTNLIHGDMFTFGENGATDARDPFENETEQPFRHRWRSGLELSGPLRRNRTFLDVAGEQEHERSETGSAVDPSLATKLNHALAAGLDPALSVRQLNPGYQPTARAETEASGRLDQQVTAAQSFFLRYSFTNNRLANNGFNEAALWDASARGSSFIRDHEIAGAWTSLFGARRVNELRAGASTRRAVARTVDTQGPGIEILGEVDFGRPWYGNDHRNESNFEVDDTYSISSGPHLLTFGGSYIRTNENETSGDGTGGLYTFLTPVDFLAKRPIEFRQSFYTAGDSTGAGAGAGAEAATNAGHVVFPVDLVAGFAQDHWTATPNLSTDVGLRYEFDSAPGGFHQQTTNLAPRAGFAWSPANRWVVRGGFGMFYDRYPLAAFTPALLRNGTSGFDQVLEGAAAQAQFQNSDGAQQKSPLTGVAPSVYSVSSHLRNGYAELATLSVEHTLAVRTTASFDYTFAHGVDLLRTRNTNLLPPSVLASGNAAGLGIVNPLPQQLGREVFSAQRANPSYDDVWQLEAHSGSVYHGVTLSLDERISDDVEFAAHYTVSKALDDTSDFNQQPQNPYAPSQDWALSDQNQQQRLVVNGLLELGDADDVQNTFTRIFRNVEFAPIVAIGSSRPLNPLAGFDANQSHSFPQSSRPFGAGRNTLRTGPQAEIDLRALRYFGFGGVRRLDLTVDAFNMLNHASVVSRSTAFGPDSTPLAGYNRPVQALPSRRLQFSVDFEF